MTHKFFLAGHVGFYNRGCEALVRGIVHALNRRVGRCEFVVPSNDIDADRRHWPDAESHGIRFVPFYRIPEPIRWWDRLTRNAPSIAGVWWPLPDVNPGLAKEIATSDAVIVTGGDVMSLDYSYASLLRWIAQVEAGLRRGVPAVLWASSVGPFTANRAVERRVVEHFRRYASLSTREGHSQAYLQSLHLQNAVQTADPAFLLEPEPVDTAALLPAAGQGGVLGFNVSPVMARARARTVGGLDELEAGIVDFWRRVVRERGLSVALIPHVDSTDGRSDQSDSAYMQRLLQRASDLRGSVRLLPHTLNAAQLKSVLSACRFFIGARTHATIGAMSSGVPTLSIAYSVKAKGINQDLFGHLRYMIETPSLSGQSLDAGLDLLFDEESSIRETLARRIPEWKERALRTADLVRATIESRPVEVVP